MSRADLGFVVSRALAVLIGIMGVRQVEGLTGTLQAMAGDQSSRFPTPWWSFASVGAIFGLTLTLWTGASRFGGSDVGEGSRLSREGLAQVLFAAMGVWMIAVALGDILAGTLWQATFPRDPQGPFWISPLVRGAIGLALFFAGDGMGLLRAIFPRRPLYEEE